MQVRRVTVDDYKDIAHWWKKLDRAILGLEVLPNLGFIVEDEKEKIVVAWLYASDSVTGFVGWTTVNPDAKKRKMPEALRLLDDAMQLAAESVGLHVLFRFSAGGGFTRFLLKSGWNDTMIKHDLLMRRV